MKQPSLSILRRRWWWRSSRRTDKLSEHRINPVAGLNLHDPDGTPVVRNWNRGGWAKAGYPIPGSDFLEAAFRYEVQARYVQKQDSATQPSYGLGQAFPLLSQAEKEFLKVKHPSPFQTHLPIIRDLKKCLNDPRYDTFVREIAADKDPTKAEVWFRINLKTTRDADMLASFVEYLRELRLGTGVPEPVRRQKPYPWLTLEVADKWLAGMTLEDYEVEKARQLLNRYGKQ